MVKLIFALTLTIYGHFCTFCELVKGEENKLTTFSTWTIMLGCNESNIIFTEDDEIFCTALPIHLRVQSMIQFTSSLSQRCPTSMYSG